MSQNEASNVIQSPLFSSLETLTVSLMANNLTPNLSVQHFIHKTQFINVSFIKSRMSSVLLLYRKKNKWSGILPKISSLFSPAKKNVSARGAINFNDRFNSDQINYNCVFNSNNFSCTWNKWLITFLSDWWSRWLGRVEQCQYRNQWVVLCTPDEIWYRLMLIRTCCCQRSEQHKFNLALLCCGGTRSLSDRYVKVRVSETNNIFKH